MESDKKDQEKLFNMVRERKYSDILNFINNNPEFDYNFQDDNGVYFIIYIVAINSIDILRKLLNLNIRVDLYDDDGYSILYIPIKFGNLDIIQLLLDYNNSSIGIPIHLMVDKNGWIAINYAIHFKNYECFKLLLKITPHNTVDNFRNTILHVAIHTYSVKFIQTIISEFKNIKSIINSVNKFGETALHFASRYNLPDVAKLLLENGADPNFQNFENHATPLHVACDSSYDKIIQILLDYNADVNLQNMLGYTPAHISVLNNAIFILKLLMTHKNSAEKINLNVFDANLEYPLHNVLKVVPENVYEFIELLLPKTDINFQNNEGDSVLMLMCSSSIWKKYKNILKEKRIDITLKNNKR